jgi:hypothetical protein
MLLHRITTEVPFVGLPPGTPIPVLYSRGPIMHSQSGRRGILLSSIFYHLANIIITERTSRRHSNRPRTRRERIDFTFHEYRWDMAIPVPVPVPVGWVSKIWRSRRSDDRKTYSSTHSTVSTSRKNVIDVIQQNRSDFFGKRSMRQ